MAKQTTENFYNEDIKKQFISDCYSNVVRKVTLHVISTMNFAALYEVKYETDFMSFNKEQFADFYDGCLSNFAAKTTTIMVSFLRNYVTWANRRFYITYQQANEHPVNNYTVFIKEQSVQKISSSVESKCRAKYVGSFDDFKDYCTQFFKEDQYEMIKAALCLSWLGFSRDQIANMKVSDFLKNDRTICSVYIRDDFLYSSILRAATSDGYVMKMPRQSKDGNKSEIDIRYNYVASDLLIRSTRKYRDNSKEKTLPMAIRLIIPKEEKIYDLYADRIDKKFATTRLTIPTVAMSRYFSDCYEYELKHGYDNMVKKMFGPKSSGDRKLDTECREIDYINWRMTFKKGD